MGLYEMMKKTKEKYKDFDDGFYEIEEIYPDNEETLICRYNIHECNCGKCETEIPCGESATCIHMEYHFPSPVCDEHRKEIKKYGC